MDRIDSLAGIDFESLELVTNWAQFRDLFLETLDIVFRFYILFAEMSYYSRDFILTLTSSHRVFQDEIVFNIILAEESKVTF